MEGWGGVGVVGCEAMFCSCGLRIFHPSTVWQAGRGAILRAGGKAEEGIMMGWRRGVKGAGESVCGSC